MKAKVTAAVILLVLCVGVWCNTLHLDKTIDEITEDIKDFEIGDDAASASIRAREIFENFKRKETYISTTVNHNDLTDIEALMSEMIGCLEAEMTDEARVAKSRLIDTLGHLRRLSGVNIDSIL